MFCGFLFGGLDRDHREHLCQQESMSENIESVIWHRTCGSIALKLKKMKTFSSSIHLLRLTALQVIPNVIYIAISIQKGTLFHGGQCKIHHLVSHFRGNLATYYKPLEPWQLNLSNSCAFLGIIFDPLSDMYFRRAVKMFSTSSSLGISVISSKK